ncbi:hypothetical protein M011DRAFT_470426 [Sporormia fimetaria CBS 119925]|uniref:Uncharacterized protein n=1 Tax=Sporormia fimetaria CBS 119925 TaxID=1340428 RepID=A0A6A6V5U6_9PLEO|nr:hypothetical protein M011DRAFT_470426 [Sporormia fimetaria CBS 119925]
MSNPQTPPAPAAFATKALSPTAFMIGFFGWSALTTGVLTLLRPSLTTVHLCLPLEAEPAVVASGLAAIAMGVFYILAAVQENRAFFYLSLCTRGLTTCVMYNVGGRWMQVAVWEGFGVLGTLGAMAWERWGNERWGRKAWEMLGLGVIERLTRVGDERVERIAREVKEQDRRESKE